MNRLNQITLHALCVAIPHAVMLLYALIDILPFPRQYIHHEIQTSSVECHDEMSFVAGLGADGAGKGKGKALAIFEEDEARIRSRTKVSRRRTSVEIDTYGTLLRSRASESSSV